MGDPSALIFVALALVWAVYLIPKALEHHEQSARNRGVETFSSRLKVLARRDAVSRRRTELVTDVPAAVGGQSGNRPDAASTAASPSPAKPAKSDKSDKPAKVKTPRQPRARKTVSAAARRRRVLSVILSALVAVGVFAATGVVAAGWLAAPLGILIMWLVACRVMVRRELRRAAARRAVDRARIRPVSADGATIPATAQVVAPGVAQVVAQVDNDEDGYRFVPASHELRADDVPAASGEFVEEVGATDEPGMPAPLGPKPTWEPQPLTLPMYVAKAPAPRRSVMTIDLESTGVWTSGNTEADSELARQADAAQADHEVEQERRSS